MPYQKPSTTLLVLLILLTSRRALRMHLPT
jgi:hypothetical protein